MAGTQRRAAVGDGGLGSQAAVLQLPQAHRPGIAVACLFLRKQIAVGGMGTEAHQDRLLGLVEFIVGADADGGQILTLVVRLGRADAG